VTAAVVGVAAMVYALHGFENFLDYDNAIYAYGAQQALAGIPPYKSVFNITGPLAYLLPVPGVALARAVGIEDLTGIRVFFLAISALVVGGLYVLARDLFKSRATGVAAAAAFLTFYTFLHNATAGPREKTPMLLFVVVALISAVRRRWFLAGVAGALAPLVWQPSGLVPVAILIAAATSVSGRQRWRAIGGVMLGGALPAAAITVYFVLKSALPDFVDGALLVNLRYTTTSSESFLERFWRILHVVHDGDGWSAWIIATGLVAMAGVLLWRIHAVADWRGLLHDRFAVILIAFLPCVAWTSYDFQGPPDLFILLPFAALGIGSLVYSVEQLMGASFSRAAAVLVTTGSIVLASWTAVHRSNQGLLHQHRSVVQMLAEVPPDAQMMSLGAPQPLVLAGRRNPNPYVILGRGLAEHLHATWPGGMEGFLHDLDSHPPELIAFGPYVWGTRSEMLTRWMYDNYVEWGSASEWTWFVHRSIAEQIGNR
jgi:hypothetical protein